MSLPSPRGKDSIPAANVIEQTRRLLNRAAKRVFDVAVSIAVLCVALPLLLLACVAIKLETRGPALYVSERIGRGGRPFRMIKLRTMVVGADAKGPNFTIESDTRVTRVGRILRSWKLDEVPQFMNVLKGDMSIVGPRPDVPYYYALYTPEQRTVYRVRPGMAGPAFIEYRNEEEILARSADPEGEYLERIMHHKIDLDLEYAKRVSFMKDMRLIARAFRVVLFS